MAAPIPFEFVFEELTGLDISTKPMFGCLGMYCGNKIIFIQRLKNKPPVDDGLWIATTPAHHESLQKEFPQMRSIEIFGPGVTGWQVLPLDGDDFESSVVRACELVRRRDPRIGKIPKSRVKSPRSKSVKRRKSRRD